MAAVSPHRPALSFHTARPKPSHRGLVSGFWHKPAPHLALANAQPPRRLHLINPRPPPLRIAPHRHFTWHTRNRARPLGFGHLDQTPPRPASHMPLEGRITTTTATTSPHYPPPPYYTAVLHGTPEIEHARLVLGIWTQPPFTPPYAFNGTAALPPSTHFLITFHMARSKPSTPAQFRFFIRVFNSFS